MKNDLTRKAVLLAVGLCWFTAVQSQEEAKQWLERMIQATQQLSYEGTFVYLQGQAVEVMRIVHSSHNGQQRMYSLNGAPREVVVENEAVICALPTQQIVFSVANHKRSPFPISLPRELEQLEKWYRFELLGKDRIADRTTRIVAIQPRDPLRFGYRLWLDEETAMVLRSALVDTAGQLIEQLIFTDIEFKPTIDSALLQPRHVSVSAAQSVKLTSGQPAEPSSWVVADLPPGFRLMLHQRYPGTIGQHSTEHLVYSDGLATASVFIELLDDVQNALLQGASRIEAMNAFGVVVDKYQVLVVGEVPAATAEQIAKSIQYAPGIVAK